MGPKKQGTGGMPRGRAVGGAVDRARGPLTVSLSRKGARARNLAGAALGLLKRGKASGGGGALGSFRRGAVSMMRGIVPARAGGSAERARHRGGACGWDTGPGAALGQAEHWVRRGAVEASGGRGAAFWQPGWMCGRSGERWRASGQRGCPKRAVAPVSRGACRAGVSRSRLRGRGRACRCRTGCACP